VNRISTKKIEWTVPKEWHIQKVRTELSGILTIGACTRIILISVALALGICFWAESAMGPLEFNWFRAIVISVSLGIGMCLLSATTAFLPQKICISAKGIDVRGHRSFRHKFGDMDAISIQRSAPAILVFQKGSRKYCFAIAESLDLEQLRQNLEHLSGRSVQLLETEIPGFAFHPPSVV
jgi:hypothetical protein